MKYTDYYVYAFLRNDGSPYYIGKGRNTRAFQNSGRAVSMPSNRKLIVFLETNLTNVGALALERRMIRWYGKKIDNTGILRNISDGGDGNPGLSHSNHTINKFKKRIPWNKGIKTGPQNPIHTEKAASARKGKLRGPYKGNSHYTNKSIAYQHKHNLI